LVSAARAPYYFAELGVPDTLDGRFDLVGLFAALVIRRLRQADAGRAGPVLAQAVFDAMFADMDFNLRELGVGDLSVAKRMRAMWEAFHGRALAYQAPLDARDEAALAEALARNVWRGAAPEGAARALAHMALRQAAHLGGQDVAALIAGQVDFLPAGAAA
jgi:cytochrome b pre-mRNA-processing protein 3